jgi:hypothetical protein
MTSLKPVVELFKTSGLWNIFHKNREISILMMKKKPPRKVNTSSKSHKWIMEAQNNFDYIYQCIKLKNDIRIYTATSKSVHVIRKNAISHPILGLLILPGPKKGSYLPINSVVPSSSQPSNKSAMHKLIPIKHISRN